MPKTHRPHTSRAPRPALLRHCSHHTYDVGSPDALTAKGGIAVLAYAGGKGVAAVRRDMAGGARTLLMGIPLEAVWPDAQRLALTAQLVALTVAASPCATVPDPGADAGPAGESDAGESDGTGGPDAGGDAAASGADAGFDGGPGADGTGDTAQGTDATASADTAMDGGVAARQPARVDNGCGCQVAGGTKPPTLLGGAMVWALALLALGLWRRWPRRMAICRRPGHASESGCRCRY